MSVYSLRCKPHRRLLRTQSQACVLRRFYGSSDAYDGRNSLESIPNVERLAYGSEFVNDADLHAQYSGRSRMRDSLDAVDTILIDIDGGRLATNEATNRPPSMPINLCNAFIQTAKRRGAAAPPCSSSSP